MRYLVPIADFTAGVVAHLFLSALNTITGSNFCAVCR